jgi:magnesium transporter
MIKYYKTQDGKLKQLEAAEQGCWINIYPPFNHEHLKELSDKYHIALDFLTDSLDLDEISRFEREDGADLIVLKVPYANEDEQGYDARLITIPIGIILAGDVILTISSYENPVIDCFLNNNVKNFTTADHTKFALQLFDRCVFYFLYFLKEINSERNSYEKELYHSMRNVELTKLLTIEKSLVFFVTSLRSNELMMLKVQRIDFLKIKDDEVKREFFDDIIVDSSQALEMANVYTNILSGTMDAFASVISNNLNMVMKRLTSVTIVLTIPMIIISFYSMNVRVPFESNPNAFYLVIVLSVFSSGLLIWYFIRRRWF